MLSICGSYLDDSEMGRNIKQAILNAGWKEPDFKAPRVSEKYKIPDYLECEIYCQPFGSLLFGGRTKEEYNTNLTNLKKALKPFGIMLKSPRKMSIAEQL